MCSQSAFGIFGSGRLHNKKMLDFLWGGADDHDAQPAPDAPPAAGAVGAAAAPAPAAPAAAAGAAAAAAPARGRGRGRGRGHDHGRAGLARAWQERHRAREERAFAAAAQVAEISNPALQNLVSEQFAFSWRGTLTQERRSASRLLFDPSHLVVVDKSRKIQRLREHALATHTTSVRDRLPALFDDCELAVAMSVADDATMWCRTPADEHQKAAEARKRRTRIRIARQRGSQRAVPQVAKKRIAAGTNKATTVLNVVAHLYLKSRRANRGAALVRMHSPTQALAQANWRTIYERKSRWAAWNGGACGSMWHSAALKQKFDDTAVVLMLSTADSATTSDCVDAAEEKSCFEATDSAAGRWRLHWSVRCQGHQACLGNRAAADQCGDFSSTLVRLGHLWEGARNVARLMEAADKILDAFYDHIFVDEFPAAPAHAHATTEEEKDWMLKTSMATLDFAEEDVADVKTHFNSHDWRTLKITHFCCAVGGRCCPSGCTSKESGLEIAKQRMRQVLVKGPGLCLAYRWKGVEKAAAWNLRTRGVHDIGRRCLRLLYSNSDIDKAQAEVDKADGGDVASLSYQTASTVKAGAVLRAFDLDAANTLSYKFLLLCGAFQKYLNKVMAADKATCNLITLMSTAPLHPDTLEAKRKCVVLNYEFSQAPTARP